MKTEIPNTAKKPADNLNQRIRKILILTVLTITNIASTYTLCFANPDVVFNKTIDFIAGWINKFGFAIAFIGAVMFAMGFRNDDAEGKTRGLRTLVAGFIVAAVAMKVVYNGIFGLGTP